MDDPDMELQHVLTEIEHDPAVRRQSSRSQLERELKETDDLKWVVKDLRRLIGAMRDLDFLNDSREKIPEKWSNRPDYLPDYVDFFDPQNGPKMEKEKNKRGKKPNKSTLLPLFKQMRDHHFPNIADMRNAMMYMNQCNVRRRHDASNNVKAGVFANIDIPTVVTGVFGGHGKQVSGDYKGSKPSTDNFFADTKPQISGPLIPTFVEEQEPVDITLDMDQESIEKYGNSDDLIDIYVERETSPVPAENLDVAMEEEVTTTTLYYENAASHDGVWSGNGYQQDLQAAVINNEALTPPNTCFDVEGSPSSDGKGFQMDLDPNMLTEMGFHLEEIPSQQDDDLLAYFEKY